MIITIIIIQLVDTIYIWENKTMCDIGQVIFVIQNLQLLNHIIIIKTKVLLPQA